MSHRRLFVLAVAASTSCTSMSAHFQEPRFDESRPYELPCLAETEKVQDVWYVRIARTPERKADEPARFASGEFVARVGLWVTFAGEGQQLITVLVRSSSDRERVDTGRVSAGSMIAGKKIVDAIPSKCQAFPPLK